MYTFVKQNKLVGTYIDEGKNLDMINLINIYLIIKQVAMSLYLITYIVQASVLFNCQIMIWKLTKQVYYLTTSIIGLSGAQNL